MLIILIFIPAISAAQPAAADSLNPSLIRYDYNFESMKILLSSVRVLEHLPPFPALDEKTDLSSEPVADEIEDLYREVQRMIFDNRIVQVAPCANCHFRADYGAGIVFYNPASVAEIKLKYQDWQGVLKYIFAHETSHLIQNMSCYKPFTETSGVTLNNLTIPCTEQIFPSSEADEATRKFLIFHAETDVYMALNMHRSGFRSWDTVFSYLENEAKKYDQVRDGKVVAADFRNRARAIKASLKHLGYIK